LDEIRVLIRRPVLHRVFEYWDGRRAGRAFPSRRDIDPLDLPFALGSLILIDVLRDPLRFRYRLVGTTATTRWGYDMTGKFVDDLPTPERRAIILDQYRRVVESARPLAIHGTHVLDGRNWVYDSVMMPLGQGGTIDMILICVEYAQRDT